MKNGFALSAVIFTKAKQLRKNVLNVALVRINSKSNKALMAWLGQMSIELVLRKMLILKSLRACVPTLPVNVLRSVCTWP